jgi:hypothetical protein
MDLALVKKMEYIKMILIFQDQASIILQNIHNRKQSKIGPFRKEKEKMHKSPIL